MAQKVIHSASKSINDMLLDIHRVNVVVNFLKRAPFIEVKNIPPWLQVTALFTWTISVTRQRYVQLYKLNYNDLVKLFLNFPWKRNLIHRQAAYLPTGSDFIPWNLSDLCGFLVCWYRDWLTQIGITYASPLARWFCFHLCDRFTGWTLVLGVCCLVSISLYLSCLSYEKNS